MRTTAGGSSDHRADHRRRRGRALRGNRLALFAAVVLSAMARSGYAQEPQAPVVNRRMTAPKTYGTSDVTYYRMAAADFTPIQSPGCNGDYTDTFVAGGSPVTFRRYGIHSNCAAESIASPHLPEGALLVYMALDSCDTDTVFQNRLWFYNCTSMGECADAPIAEVITNHNGCERVEADLTSYGIYVDSFGFQLVFWVGTYSGTSSNQFAGVVVGYKLQVSAAPGTPTFNDVAPGDFGYQYIEALAASGITGGCGGGNFCPNANLTRAQMAVFLAKALGLHWQ